MAAQQASIGGGGGERANGVYLFRSDGQILSLDPDEAAPSLPSFFSTLAYSNSSEQAVFIRSTGQAYAFGVDIPEPTPGTKYIGVGCGEFHTALLSSDGAAWAVGLNRYGQCDIPPLPRGLSYTAIACGAEHTVLICSDGSALACGDNEEGQCNIPRPPPGIVYHCVACGQAFTALLRSDGKVFLTDGARGFLLLEAEDDLASYTSIASGWYHLVMLRSDGQVETYDPDFWGTYWGCCGVPPLPAGLRYVHVAASECHTVLLRSDGNAIAFGSGPGQGPVVPELPVGLFYVDPASPSHWARRHSVFLVAWKGNLAQASSENRSLLEFLQSERNSGSPVGAIFKQIVYFL